MKSTSDGIMLRLKVSPGASREGISRGADGTLRIAVTATAERGKANAAAVALLARALQVPKSSIAVIQGSASRQKTLRILGDPNALGAKLETLGHD